MPADRRTIAVTGASGFVGRNLIVRLGELGHEIHAIDRNTPAAAMRSAIAASDAVFHLAGANRVADPADFIRVNRDYTASIADAIVEGGRRPLVVFSSSRRATDGSDYGMSKRAGEEVMLRLAEQGAAEVLICRLPNIFGKWARPDHNSVVATFCHRLARGLPIEIHDPAAALSLAYIDDLIDQWCRLIAAPLEGPWREAVLPQYHTTVGEVADLIQGFATSRALGNIGQVGTGLERALYATFVSHLPEEAFSYPLTAHVDQRGSFSELLRTPNCGQFSWFTAHAGVTRGGHYHHSKVEKFVIVRGEALFRFRHILSGATREIRASAATPVVIETIPGWAHDVTNVGDDEMISLIWANEVFDRARPDTVAMPV